MTLRSDNGPWYKQHWPWILMAGPAVVIVAGIVTLWLAVVSNDGLVADDYYKQGLTVNQRLQRDQAAASLGLRADLMQSDLSVRLLVSSDIPLALPDVITVRLSHPTRAGFDQLVALKSEGGNFYGGKLAESIDGRWLVAIEDPAGQWRLHGEWLVDSGEPLRLTAKAAK
jgi:hypothetical protein